MGLGCTGRLAGMAAPTLGPCAPWITSDLVTECCPGLADPPNPEILERAVVFATNVMFRATGRQYPGLCPRVVRPCSGAGGSGCGCSCGGGADGGWGYTGWNQGGWNNWLWDSALGGWASQYPYASGWMCGCGGGCNGCELPEVVLSSPIAELTSVVINGVEQDLAGFGVQDYRTVVRKTLNANGCLEAFPCINRMSVDSSPYTGPNDGSKDHTWQIGYTYGRGPGEDGEWATAIYACNLAKLWCGADGCMLPYRVQSVLREGINIQFIDPSLFLTNGMTGLPEVDAYIRGVNPAGLIRRPSVQRLGRPSRNLRSFT